MHAGGWRFESAHLHQFLKIYRKGRFEPRPYKKQRFFGVSKTPLFFDKCIEKIKEERCP